MTIPTPLALSGVHDHRNPSLDVDDEIHANMTPRFIDDLARVRFAQRVADEMLDELQQNTEFAKGVLLRGLVGLVCMSDQLLGEAGRIWGVAPRPEELKPVLQ